MRLIFTKRDGKTDDLTIERPGAPPQTIHCPKQGIIPHDMVHYAVESVLAHHGFLSLVAGGEPLAFTTAGGDTEEAVERLVEVFQAEMWGGRIAAEDLLSTYRHACDSRGHPPVAVSFADIDSIRSRLDELTSQWDALPLNQSLMLELQQQS